MLNKILTLIQSSHKEQIFKVVLDDFFSWRKSINHIHLYDAILATYRWICQAQDVTPDGGCAASYHLINGWRPSYPETTGYIIPTMLNIADVYRLDIARDRALKMSDWECKIQLSSGAVQGGDLRNEPFPAVFNTGQVIFGWVAAYQESFHEPYILSALRAANWLLSVQDKDGAWRQGLSKLTSASTHTYNVRTAWALIVLGQVVDKRSYIESGEANLDWCLTQQLPNGWFANTGFHEGEPPLLHTIGYTIEGLLESGVLLGKDLYKKAATQAAMKLLSILEKNDVLSGRYDEDWLPTVRWRCLTGEAQMALIWLRLWEITGDQRFLQAGTFVNKQLMNLQKLESKFTGVAGGMKGSHPIWGGYMSYAYPNWAAKFFLDSLLLEMAICSEIEK
jgi:hypothetical protein